ncbi:MAG: class I SAM-dependent RNA methyltransferase [Candidatus Omnitrophota bacterium]
MDKIKLVVTSTFGLEAVIKRELQVLGFDQFHVVDGRIEFDATCADIPRLNLHLRAADRVLVKVGEFPASDFGALFDRTRELPWEDWITRDARITVVGKCVRSVLASVRSSQSIAHKAVVERLKSRFHIDWLPETGPEYTIQVAILKDVAHLTLDTSGEGLHKRGYRISTGEAPIRENLASSLVQLSFWNKDRLLLDPMCGSGTILIEAAMLARQMAPGLGRTFAAEHWPVVKKSFWDDARAKARAMILPSGGLKIRGYDIDPDRIRDAGMNARKAGVGDDIVFECKDIKDLWVHEAYGIVICNPPYGVKIGSLKELTSIYITLHNMFKNKEGWSLYILTADGRFPDFFKRARPDKVRKLFNGAMEVNYYQYYGERPRQEKGTP